MVLLTNQELYNLVRSCIYKKTTMRDFLQKVITYKNTKYVDALLFTAIRVTVASFRTDYSKIF